MFPAFFLKPKIQKRVIPRGDEPCGAEEKGGCGEGVFGESSRKLAARYFLEDFPRQRCRGKNHNEQEGDISYKLVGVGATEKFGRTYTEHT